MSLRKSSVPWRVRSALLAGLIAGGGAGIARAENAVWAHTAFPGFEVYSDAPVANIEGSLLHAGAHPPEQLPKPLEYRPADAVQVEARKREWRERIVLPSEREGADAPALQTE